MRPFLFLTSRPESDTCLIRVLYLSMVYSGPGIHDVRPLPPLPHSAYPCLLNQQHTITPSHHSKKIQSYSAMHARTAAQNKEIDERDQELRDARRGLVKQAGALVSGDD